MSPPGGDLVDLALYLSFAGVATLTAGRLAFSFADRALSLSLRLKAFLVAAIAGGVALFNVLIVAELMFLSTEHDLPLLIVVSSFSAAIMLIFSLWGAASLTRRLQAVLAGIRQMADGEYGEAVQVAGGDEVAQLSADLNRLAGRLQETAAQRQALDQERRELTAAISHDLRTPLASIRAMTEALADGVVAEGEEKERFYAKIQHEVERLNLLINDLFELAQLDAGAPQLDYRLLSLPEIAADVVDAMQVRAGRDGISLDVRVEGEPRLVPADGSRIERAAANLVLNALEHTVSGGRVDVAVREEAGGWLCLSVSDTGEGIAADDLPHIWNRFFQAERSRSNGRRRNGAGLGLAIVKGIVEAHGGTVGVESRAGRGSTFTLRLKGARSNTEPLSIAGPESSQSR